MGEFSEILSAVEQELRASDTSLEVIHAFPEKMRPNPQKKKLAVVPGSAFGECGRYHVRCSYATGMAELEEAVSRIARFVKTVAGK